MKNIVYLILVLVSYFNSYAQSKVEYSNSIGISIPVIFNNSNGIYYSGGNRKEPTGKATSYGINCNFQRSVYKKIFLIAGAGYFRQSFHIVRPFSFDGDPGTNLLYSTKRYFYDNTHWLIGIGYYLNLNKETRVKGLGSYNSLTSFRQYYEPARLTNVAQKPNEINKQKMKIGSTIDLSVGIEKDIKRHLSVGLDAVMPIFSNWKNDEIFIKYDYSHDSQKIAENRFSIGIAFSCKYYF